MTQSPKRLAALQPGYIPWLGFFEQVWRSDIFILHDQVAYTPQNWRNRNRIKTPAGPLYLTVPVFAKGPDFPPIRDIEIDNHSNWRKKHYQSIRHNCHKTPHYHKYDAYIKEVFGRDWTRLIDLCAELTVFIAREFGISTPIKLASAEKLEEEYQASSGEKSMTGRILHMCRKYGAGEYYNGRAGAKLYNSDEFASNGVMLRLQDYTHPVYAQQFGEFIPYLSALDLLFNHGPESLGILTHGLAKNVFPAEQPAGSNAKTGTAGQQPPSDDISV